MKEDQEPGDNPTPPPVPNPDPSVLPATLEAALPPPPYPGGEAPTTQGPTPATLEPWQPYSNTQHPPHGGGVVMPHPGGVMVGIPKGGFVVGDPGGGRVEGGLAQVGGHHPGGNPVTTQQPTLRPIPVALEDVMMMTATPPPMVNPWSHKFCGCLEDTQVCCKSYWCPCIVFGENAAALGHGCMEWGAGCVLAHCFCLSFVMGMQIRREIREQRGIDGDTCNDCLVWFFLPCCALIQEASEIKKMQLTTDPGVNSMTRT